MHPLMGVFNYYQLLFELPGGRLDPEQPLAVTPDFYLTNMVHQN